MVWSDYNFPLMLKKEGASKWKVSLIFSLINIILGLVVLFYPFSTIQVLIVYDGIFMVIGAVLNLLSLIFNKSK